MARGSGVVAGCRRWRRRHAQGGELPAQGADGGGRVVETRTQLLVQPAALLLRLPHARDGLARRLAQSCHLALQVQRAVALAPLERGELSTKHVLAHPELSPASPLRGVSTPLGGELLQRALQRVGLLPERMPHRLTLVMHVKECFLRRAQLRAACADGHAGRASAQVLDDVAQQPVLFHKRGSRRTVSTNNVHDCCRLGIPRIQVHRLNLRRSFGRNACAGRGVRRRESPVRTVKVRSAAEISARRAKIFFARCARAGEFRSPRSQIEIYARGGGRWVCR